MPSCEGIGRVISRFVDGELDAEQTVILQSHVEFCADCRRELEALLRQERLLERALGGELFGRQVAEGVMHALADPSTRLRARADSRLLWLWRGLAKPARWLAKARKVPLGAWAAAVLGAAVVGLTLLAGHWQSQLAGLASLSRDLAEERRDLALDVRVLEQRLAAWESTAAPASAVRARPNDRSVGRAEALREATAPELPLASAAAQAPEEPAAPELARVEQPLASPPARRSFSEGGSDLPSVTVQVMRDLQGIALWWSPPKTEESPVGYNVYRKTEQGSEYSGPINPEPLKGTSYFDDSIDPAAVYWYRVDAVPPSGPPEAFSDPIEVRKLSDIRVRFAGTGVSEAHLPKETAYFEVSRFLEGVWVTEVFPAKSSQEIGGLVRLPPSTSLGAGKSDRQVDLATGFRLLRVEDAKRAQVRGLTRVRRDPSSHLPVLDPVTRKVLYDLVDVTQQVQDTRVLLEDAAGQQLFLWRGQEQLGTYGQFQ